MNDVIKIQKEFGDYLFNYIQKKVQSIEDAEDIYQEVIVKIIEKSNQIQKSQSLKSWLFTIAKNQIIDHYRTKKHGVELEQVKGLSENFEEDDTYQELGGCLDNFILKLPDDYKDIIIQSEIEGKSQKELSLLYDMSYVTLRSKVQRGRARIKEMIVDACNIEKDNLGRLMSCSPNIESSECKNTTSSCS